MQSTTLGITDERKVMQLQTARISPNAAYVACMRIMQNPFVIARFREKICMETLVN